MIITKKNILTSIALIISIIIISIIAGKISSDIILNTKKNNGMSLSHIYPEYNITESIYLMPVIVKAEILEIYETEWTSNNDEGIKNMILYDMLVKVNESYKNCDEESIVLRLYGGVADGYDMETDEKNNFNVGEEYIFFLSLP